MPPPEVVPFGRRIVEHVEGLLGEGEEGREAVAHWARNLLDDLGRRDGKDELERNALAFLKKVHVKDERGAYAVSAEQLSGWLARLR